ncbi:MAG: FecR family protein [Sphingobacterium sp.]|jgi:ferric-dicitrate binding protein FerR (iron transport regulator)|uniref:FecR family protein n=1 Tax=Sphingobacterium sp. TaxID=341027 RepID=UPI00283F4F98|nr:FecR family protein [Sphingobacterium sp.]MDR3010823.1 FecR family protein [Sphingobacterium sp.]
MIEDDFLILVQKLNDNSINKDELILLESMLRNRKNSQNLLLSVRKLFDELTTNDTNLPDNPNKEKTKNRLLSSISVETNHRTKKSVWANRAIKLAAISLIALFTALYFYTSSKRNHTKVQWATIHTNYGERKKVILNDSTTVLLNGNSTLTYPLLQISNMRIVKLKGEAFFEVSPDPAKPFLVIAKNFTTQVVGTAFNIDSDIERLVEVSSGKVNVYRIDEKDLIHIIANPTDEPQSGVGRFFGKIKSTLSLSSGDKGQLQNDDWHKSPIIEKLVTVENKITLIKGERAKLTSTNDWAKTTHNNMMWFNNETVHINEPLSQIAQKVYRIYGDSIAVDPALADTKISITFKNKDKTQVIKTLAELSNANLTFDKSKNIWNIKATN